MKKAIVIWGVLIYLFSGQISGQNLQGIRIYVNPGHGGFDSNDRNVPIPPFALGDTAGFWESKSNLVKGLHLKMLLEAAGAKVFMSRVQNRTVDDRPLSAIAEEANANQADFMISIHSNAFNAATNYPLMLYHGKDNNPVKPQNLQLAILFWDALFSNQSTQWSYFNRNVRGDKSFYPESQDGLGVLRPLTVPGLLSEGSFHDYIPETYRLMNREYKQLEAWHFFRAFCTFYGGNPGKKGKIAGTVKDSYRKVTTYSFLPNGKDQWLPVNGAKVTLQPGNLIYQIDNLNNGFFLFDNLDPGTYQLTFEADKYETRAVENIQVDSAKVTYTLCSLNQDRSDPMKVENYAPKADPGELVSLASPVVFWFNFEVDTASFREAFSITPSVSGTFAYEDFGRMARFIPSGPLQISTLYNVLLKKTVRHIGNLPMENDFSFSFTTVARNRLTLINAYPREGMENVYPNTQVRLHFDGRLQNSELSSRITLFDSGGKAVSRSGFEVNMYPGKAGSYAFTPGNLQPDSSYILKLDKDLADEEGVKLLNSKEIRFKVTRVFQSDLPVVYDFETSATDWKIDTLKSKNIITGTVTRILRYSGSKLFGGYSYRLLYGFSHDEAWVVVRPPAPLAVIKNGQSIGMYIWGDLSENQFIILAEKDGTEHEIPFTKMDFSGWQFREVKTNFPDQTANYSITGFKLVSAATPFSVGAAVYFDNMLISDTPFTGTPDRLFTDQEKLVIYPNPVVDRIYVRTSGPDGFRYYRITSISGITVKEGSVQTTGGQAVIAVAGIGRGTYILQFNNEVESKNAVFIIR